jgi:hypothetical protein
MCCDEIIAALDMVEYLESGKVGGGLGQDDYKKNKKEIELL